jgi:hypothetical protein
VVKASLATTDVDAQSGVPIYDLIFEKIRVDRTNERAVKSWKSMNGGTKLGMSIGAQIPEGGAVRNKKTGTLLIAHVNLLETSIVGIPANPRSWMDAVAKAYKAGPKVFALGAIEVEETEVAPETIVQLDATEASSDPSPETNAPSQDLVESAPENDGAAATPDVIAAATDVLERTADSPVDEDQARALLVEAHNSLATVTNQLVETDAALAAAEKRAETADAEREAMKAAAEEAIANVANLIEQVGNLPAGRQASFKTIQEAAGSQAVDWESLGFAPEVVRMLKRGAHTE